MAPPRSTFAYPAAPKGDVVDDYHGTPVADPYRWLEDPDSPQTRTWVEAQNEFTASFLAASPDRERMKTRLTRLWDFPKYSAPQQRGGRYFYWQNSGLQNQPVLYLQRAIESEPVPILDPNTWSPDGTSAVTSQSFAEDGRLLAYGVSHKGSDWQEVHVREVDSGAGLPDTIRWCKFASLAWQPDGSGFYYNRYPDPGTVPAEDQTNFQRVCWHQLGAAQDEDQVVFQHEDKELRFAPRVTDDGAYLVLHGYRGTERMNRLYYGELASAGPFVRLIDEPDAQYEFVDNVGATFYVHTDLDAPHGRIVAIDLAQPQRERWREIVPETEDVIDYVAMVNDHLVVVYLHDVHHAVKLFTREGQPAGAIELPGIGSILGLTGRRTDTELFLGYASYLQPQTIFRYDFTTARLETFRAPEIDFDPAGYENKQVFYHSKDGTRVPMFLTHKKGLALDGRNPTLLYGYGGFNISLTPAFSASRLVWLEQGGVFAVANLRGGAEYGKAWHEAGILDRKQNVFDDFIAAAEWLIDSGYTSRERLVIEGGSNGGLLVGACMTQRPDLFGAVVCHVPVADMLRYHKFTIGRYWVSDFGNAEADPAHFGFLYAYSPLHNVKPGIAYPPTLITSADTDDRVVPGHAKKFAATLQAYDAGLNPILIRIETKAGHGLGKPTAKVIEEQADIYAFLFQVLGLAYDHQA